MSTNRKSAVKIPRLRILMISGTFYPKINGTVIAVANMMKALKSRGHEVWLLTRAIKGARSGRWEGIDVVRVGPDLRGLAGRFVLLLRQLHTAVSLLGKGFDVIHANGFYPLIVGLVVGKLLRKPVVVTFHGFQRLWSKEARWTPDVIFTLGYPIERLLLGRTEKVIFQSRALQSKIEAIYGLPHVNAEIVSNTIDTSVFGFRERSYDTQPSVLFVGSLSRVHGADLLIQAAPRIIEVVPEVKFVIVGSGPRRRYLEELIQRLGLCDSVHLIGQIADPYALAELYALSSVVVIPLRYKGYILSLVALEAMATGRPVITTMTLDLELADHGAYMVELNPSEIAETTTKILQMDHAGYSMVSVSARKYIETFCAREATAMRLEKIYFELIGK